jgi:hypothetical protein
MLYAPNLFARRPSGAAYDYSGVVVDGNGTQFKPGDEVYGFLQPRRFFLGLLAYKY